MGIPRAMADTDPNPQEVGAVRRPFHDVPQPEQTLDGKVNEFRRQLAGQISTVGTVADGAMRDARAAKAIVELLRAEMEEKFALLDTRIDEILAERTEDDEAPEPEKKAAPAKKKKD